jgi:hypothetical protein
MFSYIHIISLNGIEHHMVEFDFLRKNALTHTHTHTYIHKHTHTNIPEIMMSLFNIQMCPSKRYVPTFIAV